jgi:hypothetical protein
VEKLLRHGEGWLREHPERELITNRYLKHQKRLAQEALSRLIGDEAPEADEAAETRAHEEEAIGIQNKPARLQGLTLEAFLRSLDRIIINAARD